MLLIILIILYALCYRVHSSKLFGILLYKSMPDPSLSTSHSEETIQANVLSSERSNSKCFRACYQFWRFLPDIMSVGIGLLFGKWSKSNFYPYQFIFVPSAFFALIFVLMLQRGSARFNFTRLFLSIHPVSTMGYASYAIYMFQRPAFSHWGPYFVLAPKGVSYQKWEYKSNWFDYLPVGNKMVGITILTIICWLIHKYYQDKFIPFVYEKIHKCLTCFGNASVKNSYDNSASGYNEKSTNMIQL